LFLFYTIDAIFGDNIDVEHVEMWFFGFNVNFCSNQNNKCTPNLISPKLKNINKLIEEKNNWIIKPGILDKAQC